MNNPYNTVDQINPDHTFNPNAVDRNGIQNVDQNMNMNMNQNRSISRDNINQNINQNKDNMNQNKSLNKNTLKVNHNLKNSFGSDMNNQITNINNNSYYKSKKQKQYILESPNLSQLE